MLPSTDLKASAPRIIVFSVLNGPAHPYRYRRFACPLAGADARLAEKRGSVTPSFQGTFTPYLLPVRLAHQIRTCALTHPAPTSGCAVPIHADGKALIRPRVPDFQFGPVSRDKVLDPVPFEAVFLRSAAQALKP